MTTTSGRHENPPAILESRNPIDHLKADHTVTATYPEWQTGYLALYADTDPRHATPDDIEIYDSKSGEAGETYSIQCYDCGYLELDTEYTDPETGQTWPYV